MEYLAAELAHAHIYTMRELNQDTAGVIRAINESGEPAVITRHGRFIALIHPLANLDVESHVLSAVIGAVENSSQLTGKTTASGIHGAQDVANDLDLNVDVGRFNGRELGPAPDDEAYVHEAGDLAPVSLAGLTPDQRDYVREQIRSGNVSDEREVRRLIGRVRRGHGTSSM